MKESTESVKRLLTAISQNATDHNIISLAKMLNYNEKQLRQDIKAIDLVNITDRPGSREQLRDQEDQATKGSYFLRKYILEHPEINSARFKCYELYEYTGHVTGEGKVSVFVYVLSKDESIETEDREVLIEWTFTNSAFEKYFKDPEKAAEHTVKFDNGAAIFGDCAKPDIFSKDREIPLFAQSETGSLSFNSYKEFIREVRRKLKHEGHDEYEILDITEDQDFTRILKGIR